MNAEAFPAVAGARGKSDTIQCMLAVFFVAKAEMFMCAFSLLYHEKGKFKRASKRGSGLGVHVLYRPPVNGHLW